MAKVTITITDGDEVQVDAEFDPPANTGAEDTPAQQVAKAVLIALSEALGGHDIYTEHGEPGN